MQLHTKQMFQAFCYFFSVYHHLTNPDVVINFPTKATTAIYKFKTERQI